MPNGEHNAELEQDRIKKTQREGWEFLSCSDRPDWVVNAAGRQDLHGQPIGRYKIFHGNTDVYRVESTFGLEILVYRKLKSDHFPMTAEEGRCPNCQAYVKRYEDDRFLTCHRCGWTVGSPILRWLTHPSWINYHFGD